MPADHTKSRLSQTLSPEDLPSCKHNSRREITLQINSILWRRQKGLLEQVYRAADVAMEFFMDKERKQLELKQQLWSVTILCTHERHMRELNKRFRGKNTSCDSLAFPEQEQSISQKGGENYANINPASFLQKRDGNHYLNRYIGDIALGYQGLQRKVAEYQLDAQAHCAHVTAHAIAHLVGLNHATTKERDLMEAEEEAILRKLGFPESSPCSSDYSKDYSKDCHKNYPSDYHIS